MSNKEQLLLFIFILFNCDFICSHKIEKNETIERECMNNTQGCYYVPSSDDCKECITYISDFCTDSFDSFCQKFKKLPKWKNESKETVELFRSLNDSNTIRFCRVTRLGFAIPRLFCTHLILEASFDFLYNDDNKVREDMLRLKNFFTGKILLYMVDVELDELKKSIHLASDEIMVEADLVARIIKNLSYSALDLGFDGIYLDFVLPINATTIYKVIREAIPKFQIKFSKGFLFALHIRTEYPLDDIVEICPLIDFLIIDPNRKKAGVNTLKIEIRELSKICEEGKAFALAAIPIFPANYSAPINNISARSIDTNTITYRLMCNEFSRQDMTFKINIFDNTFLINYFCDNCTKHLDNIVPIPKEAISKMIEFALDNGYNGLSFPHYLYDDYVGDCGEGKWPLFSHAARTIKKRDLTMKETELRIDRIKIYLPMAACSLVLFLLLAVFFHSLATKILKQTPNINKYLKDPTKIASEPSPMSEGFEAQVFRGWYTNEEDTRQQVAIKAANNLYFSDEDLYEEIRLLAHCSQPSHKNIVKLIGWYCEESVASESGYSSEEGRLLAPNRYSRIRIVTEFLEGGTLKEFLATPEAKKTGRLLNFMEQICDGMAFLAQKGLVHRDLQTSNCVLDGTRTIVKIIDFGLCRWSGQNKKKIHHNFIVKLTAPECMLGHSKYTEKSDVWSFGVLSWYLFAKTEPWAEVTSAKELKRLIVHEKKQLERIVDGVDKFPLDGIYEKLIQPCWQIRPSRRPRFEELKYRIQKYVNEHKQILDY